MSWFIRNWKPIAIGAILLLAFLAWFLYAFFEAVAMRG